MCSWLLAIAVVGSMVLDRQLTPREQVIALVSAIGFSAVVSTLLWRKIRRKAEIELK